MATSKPILESAIQRKILQYLKLKGIFHFRINTGGLIRRGQWCPSPAVTKGTPDIVAILPIGKGNIDSFGNKVIWPGQFVAIEVKSAKGKLSPDQEAFKVNVEKAGGLYVVARSVEDVQRVFE